MTGNIIKAQGLELKFASDGDQAMVEGYASSFRTTPDRQGQQIAKGAFTKSLANHEKRGTRPSMLWAHKSSEVIGRWIDLREDAMGLFVRGRLNLAIGRARETAALIEAGDVGALSIGFYNVKSHMKNDAEVITEAELVEVSIVHLGADDEARINPNRLGSKQELTAFLQQSGLTKGAARRVASGGWPALETTKAERSARTLAHRIDQATMKLKGRQA